MSTAVAERNGKDTPTTEIAIPRGLEKVLIMGDLADLKPEERIAYYKAVCHSLGLNPLTKPFDYMLMKGEGGAKKLQLYANKNCTDALRDQRGITVKVPHKGEEAGLYVVTATAIDANGREDTSIGAVALEEEEGSWQDSDTGKRFFKGNGKWTPLRGANRANAMMKAETKAKRRVTLSICGLGFMADWEPEEFTEPAETGTPEEIADLKARNERKAAMDDWSAAGKAAEEAKVFTAKTFKALIAEVGAKNIGDATTAQLIELTKRVKALMPAAEKLAGLLRTVRSQIRDQAIPENKVYDAIEAAGFTIGDTAANEPADSLLGGLNELQLDAVIKELAKPTGAA